MINSDDTPKLTRRQKHWLHAYLTFNNGDPLTANLEKVQSTETIVEDLATTWDNYGLGELLENWKQCFLPSEDLEWISAKDHRQLIWLINMLAFGNVMAVDPNQAPKPFIPNPNNAQPHERYDQIIAAIDSFWLHASTKRTCLSSLKSQWSSAQVPWSKLKWINSNDVYQLDWCIDYIKKRTIWHSQPIRFANSSPCNTQEKHSHILGFLDCLYFAGRAEQELFLIKMRKTWQQRKYRNSEKAKKQVYFSLSDEAQKQLASLEKAQKQTKNRIIEDLIRQAATGKGS